MSLYCAVPLSQKRKPVIADMLQNKNLLLMKLRNKNFLKKKLQKQDIKSILNFTEPLSYMNNIN